MSTSPKTPKIGSAAWKTFVVNAIAKDPAKRSEAEREAILEAMKDMEAGAQMRVAQERAAEQDRLLAKRLEIADAEYERYDFGYEVEDGSGWEYTTPGDEFVKPLFFVNADDPDGDSLKGHFAIRFEPGTETIAEMYGVVNGAVIENAPLAPRP